MHCYPTQSGFIPIGNVRTLAFGESVTEREPERVENIGGRAHNVTIDMNHHRIHTKIDPADVMPLSPEVRKEFLARLIATCGSQAPDRQAFDILWQMITSATRDYRQALDRNDVDAQQTLNQATRLAHQIQDLLGINDRSYERIVLILVQLGVCGGFFGIYQDRWMIEERDGGRDMSTAVR